MAPQRNLWWYVISFDVKIDMGVCFGPVGHFSLLKTLIMLV